MIVFFALTKGRNGIVEKALFQPNFIITYDFQILGFLKIFQPYLYDFCNKKSAKNPYFTRLDRILKFF